jgi:hypothetical protein
LTAVGKVHNQNIQKQIELIGNKYGDPIFSQTS